MSTSTLTSMSRTRWSSLLNDCVEIRVDFSMLCYYTKRFLVLYDSTAIDFFLEHIRPHLVHIPEL